MREGRRYSIIEQPSRSDAFLFTRYYYYACELCRAGNSSAFSHTIFASLHHEAISMLTFEIKKGKIVFLTLAFIA